VVEDRLKTLARRMRREPVFYGRKLWAPVRGGRLEGLKFRRQVVIGPYVADFVCLGHRLIIEAEAPFHDEARDAVRDAWLTAQGFRVLRVPNQQIELCEREVIGAIVEATRPK